MIIRVFRAVVHDGMQDELRAFFLGTALPLVRSAKSGWRAVHFRFEDQGDAVTLNDLGMRREAGPMTGKYLSTGHRLR